MKFILFSRTNIFGQLARHHQSIKPGFKSFSDKENFGSSTIISFWFYFFYH